MPSVKLADLFDVNLLAEMLSTGMVNRQYHPFVPLAILNYSHECQFSRSWNDVTEQCRGLIYNLETEEIVARPFRKFFNAEELGPSKMGQALGKNIQATDKMDGSLGVLYQAWPGEWGIATRGSFASDQACHATELLDRYMDMDTGWVPSEESTYLFEIIYPQNRIVLDYGDMDALILLATVNIDTGHVGGPDSSHGWPGPRTKIFPATSIKEVRALPIRDNAEGFVLRNEKTGFMAKMKYEEYVRIHRIVFGMNERVVHKHLREGGDPRDLMAPVPEEFIPWIRDTCNRMLRQYMEIDNQVISDKYNIDMEMNDAKLMGKKSFALLATKAKYPHLLFMLYDKKSKYADEIWKLIPYDGRNKMAAEQTEDVA